MPLYEYQCQACGHRFEKIQKFSDPPETVCPVCGGTVEKLLSSPAIQFKGTGWYITDYARSGKGGDGGAAKADKSAKSDTSEGKGGESKGGAAAGSAGGDAGGSATTSESKPASTAPAKAD